MTTAIHILEGDTESVLEAMSLSVEAMSDICRRGLSQYHMATPYHPNNAPGTFMYMEMVHAMRENLVPADWDVAEESLSFTYNEDLSIAIAVSSGDANVGDPAKNPSFKYPKGPTTQAAVVGNARQLGLFDELPSLAEYADQILPKRVDFSSYKTWWLLTYVDLGKGVMRAELSLPTKIGSNGEVKQWESRIILEPIEFDDEPAVDHAHDPSDGPDFNVDVRKKA